MSEGVLVFSPISHTHPIAMASAPHDWKLPLGFDYWERYDTAVLESCKALIVCCLPGWDLSAGVAAEYRIADGLGIQTGHLFEPLNPDHVRHFVRAAGLL